MKKQLGITLIELMVTLAVFAILVAIGLPGLSRYSEGNRMVGQTNRISFDLSEARSEARKLGRNVVICASNNSTTATPACNTTQWELGWIYFVDTDNNGGFAAGDTLLGINEGQPAGVKIRTTNFSTAGAITFLPSGAIVGSNGTFKICGADNDTKKARAVNLNAIGRTSIARDTDTTPNDIVNDITGTDVTCP